jgi:hypothetical protein
VYRGSVSGAIAPWVIVHFWRPLIVTTVAVLAAFFLYRNNRTINFAKPGPPAFGPSSDH